MRRPRTPRPVSRASSRGAGVVRQQRDAAKAIGVAGERVGHEPVIAAVAAAADDDRAGEAELVLQCDVGFGERVARGVRAVRRKRIFVRRAEQVDVSVAAAGRQREFRCVRIGIGSLGENGHDCSLQMARGAFGRISVEGDSCRLRELAPLHDLLRDQCGERLGVPPPMSTPSCWSRAAVAGERTASRAAAASLSMMVFGVPAGAISPIHRMPS